VQVLESSDLFVSQVLVHAQAQEFSSLVIPTGQVFKQGEQVQPFAFLTLFGPQLIFGQHMSGFSSDPSVQSLIPSHFQSKIIQEK
jgi:hypothetical protein